MNLVVVPLSRAPVTFPAGWLLGGALFAHTVLVGVPIALFARRIRPLSQRRYRNDAARPPAPT